MNDAELRAENEMLKRQVAEGEATIRALIAGEVDSVTAADTLTPLLVSTAQHALRRAKERFSIVFRKSPVALAICTVDGLYVEANQRFLELVGLDRAHVIGRPSGDVMAWVDPAENERLEECLRSRLSVSDFEAALRMCNGDVRSLLISTERIDVDGRDCHLCMLTDVTDRKRADAAMAQFESFFTLSLDMLCIASPDGRFERLNPSFEVLGYTTAELCAKPFVEFVHPEDVAATLAELEKLGRGEPTARFENRYRCKDGSYRWLMWATTPDASGTLFAAARDITDRKRDEEENRRLTQKLLVSNAELEEFAMVASHDLQEPLRKIRMFGDRLSADFADVLGDEGKDYLRRMQTAAERGQSLITGLLAYSRVASRGKQLVDVDLAEVAEQVAMSAIRALVRRLVDARQASVGLSGG